MRQLLTQRPVRDDSPVLAFLVAIAAAAGALVLGCAGVLTAADAAAAGIRLGDNR